MEKIFLEKKCHNAEKTEREDPLGFFNIHSVAKLQKIEGGLSQAAACDGTRITTTAEGQEIAAGTLPIY